MPRSALKKRRSSSKKRRVVVRDGLAHRFSKFKGSGAYSYDQPGPWGQAGRAAGGVAGRALGAYLGVDPRMAALLGSKAGGLAHYLGKIFGSGSYGVTGANDGKIEQVMPQFSNGKDYVEICKREYIGDIISSATPGAFNIQDFAINPGSQQTFPWLSELCACTFQQYDIQGCIFEFKSFSANALNSTNTALGTVVAAVNYDSSDAPFGSRYEMENTNWSHSAPPSNNFLVPIECDKKQTALGGNLYIRHGAVPSGADIKTYDWGRLSIATLGCQGASVNVGSLYVNYKIRLYKQIVLAPNSCAYHMHVRPTAGVDASNWLGTARTIVDNNMNASVTNSNVITLDRTYIRQGTRFYVTYSVTGTGATIACPTITQGAGMSVVAVFNNGANAFTSVGNTTAGCTTWLYEVVNPLAALTFTFSAGTAPAVWATADCMIMQVAPIVGG